MIDARAWYRSAARRLRNTAVDNKVLGKVGRKTAVLESKQK